MRPTPIRSCRRIRIPSRAGLKWERKYAVRDLQPETRTTLEVELVEGLDLVMPGYEDGVNPRYFGHVRNGVDFDNQQT